MFSEELHSNDSIESETISKLIALREKFEGQKFASIKSTYTKNYQVGNDFDQYLDPRTQTETKVWYYNANRELCAYTHTLKNGAPDEEPELKRSAIYWFENQKLAGIYSDYSSGGQTYTEIHDRIVVPDCPLHCIALTLDGTVSEETQVTAADQEYITNLYTDFQKEYDDVIKDLLRNQNLRTTLDGYAVIVQKPWDDTSYALTYTIARPLYKKFIKGE
jgi:hypothetical protein